MNATCVAAPPTAPVLVMNNWNSALPSRSALATSPIGSPSVKCRCSPASRGRQVRWKA